MSVLDLGSLTSPVLELPFKPSGTSQHTLERENCKLHASLRLTPWLKTCSCEDAVRPILWDDYHVSCHTPNWPYVSVFEHTYGDPQGTFCCVFMVVMH